MSLQNHNPYGRLPTIRIAKVVLQETGTFNPLYARPYQSHVDGYVVDELKNRMDQATTGGMTGALISGVAGRILQPSADPGGVIHIPNGWMEKRVRFYMEVHVETNTGSQFIYHVQGFTSHPGLSLGIGGHAPSIDPSMVFYINSYIQVSRGMTYGPQGAIVRDVMTESAHMVNGQLIRQAYPSDIYSMLPHDIFNGIQANTLNNMAPQFHDLGNVGDRRAIIGDSTLRSNRANGMATNYVSSLVSSYNTSRALSGFGQGDQDILVRSRDLVYEAPVSENLLVRALSNVTGIQNTTSFTFPTLTTLDPNTPNVTEITSLGPTAKATLHQAGSTEYWQGSDRATQAATILSNAVPALMLECMINKVSFSSTNHAAGGVMDTRILAAASLTNIDMRSYYAAFTTRVEREVMFDMTYGNQDLYMLNMDVDLQGETRISISIGNSPMTVYATPSFCDSLLTPITSYGPDNYQRLVYDFENLISVVGADTSEVTINHNV